MLFPPEQTHLLSLLSHQQDQFHSTSQTKINKPVIAWVHSVLSNTPIQQCLYLRTTNEIFHQSGKRSLEPPLEYRQLWWIKVPYDLFNYLGSYRYMMQCQISSSSKNMEETPESSRLEFLENFLENNFALSDADEKLQNKLWTMAATKAAENPGDEWGLTWYSQWGIYS